jgi:hypothetical protein
LGDGFALIWSMGKCMDRVAVSTAGAAFRVLALVGCGMDGVVEVTIVGGGVGCGGTGTDVDGAVRS